MSIESDIAFLDRIPVFSLLGKAALRIVAIGAETKHVEAGEVLFSTGEQADAAYVVQRGAFSLTAGRPEVETREVIVSAGTLLGELALITETLRPVTAVAVEPATVLRISRSLFLKMLEGYPDAARRLRDVIAARTDQTATEIQAVRTALGSETPAR